MTRALLFDAPGPPGPAGPRGLQGPQGISSVQSAIVQTEATAPGKARLFVNGALAPFSIPALPTSPVVVPITYVTAGGSAQFVSQGFHTSIPSLGAGVACAVGCKADGTLCRITDPLCVTGKFIVGYCDSAGTISVQPQLKKKYEVLDFGADNSGTSLNDTAIAAALAKAKSGDSVYFAPGVYRTSVPVGPLPEGVILEGETEAYDPTNSGSGAVISFEGASGDAIRVCSQVNINATCDNHIQHLTVRRNNAANLTGAGIGMMGGGNIFMEHLQVQCFKFGIVVDGSNQVHIDDVIFNNGPSNEGTPIASNIGSASIWLTDGNERGEGWTIDDATNIVTVLRCAFNAHDIAIMDHGGTQHLIMGCQCNIGTAFAEIRKSIGSTYIANYSEGSGTGSSPAHFRFTAATTTIVQACTIKSHGAFGGCPFIRFDGTNSCYNLGLYDNDIVTNPAQGVVGALNGIIGAHVSINNYYASSGGPMYDGDVRLADTAIIRNVSIDQTRYAGGDCGQDSAQNDHMVRTTAIPLSQVRDSTYVYDQLWIDSTQKTRRNQTLSSPLGNNAAGKLEAIETGSVVSGGTALVLASIVLPVKSRCIVELTATAGRSSDESKCGAWKITQQAYRTTGGNVTLVGSPTSIYASADVGFSAPTIAVNTSSQIVYASCPSRADGEINYWCAQLRILNAQT